MIRDNISMMLRIHLFRYTKKLFVTKYLYPLHQMILLHTETVETYCVSCKKITVNKISSVRRTKR